MLFYERKTTFLPIWMGVFIALVQGLVDKI